MTLDTRTPAEIAYDATSLYLKPTENDRITLAREADRLLDEDTPISPVESAIIGVLYPDIPLSADEETVLDILLKKDEDTRMRQWREQARITGSPELRSLLDWIDARFDAGDSTTVDRVLALLPSDEQEDTDTMIAILEECDGGEPEPVPFGQLADGTPIMGTFDGVNGVYDRWEVVEVNRGGWYVTGDASGCFGFGMEDGTIDIEEIRMPQIVALRDLLNSGAFERMVIAAEAWGRGDTEPPTFTAPLGRS